MAAASYLIVAVFAIGAAIAYSAGASRFVVIAVGVAVAAPLAIAFIGDRITGIRAFSVEVQLRDVGVKVEGVPGDLSTAIMSVAEAGPSAAPDITSVLEQVVDSRTRFLRINLRGEDYWWSTRVFLVAALAEDYTEIESLVFVRGGEERSFVGLVAPQAAHRRMAIAFPNYENAYRKLRSEVDAAEAADEITGITLEWALAVGQAYPPEAGGEPGVKQIVTAALLRSWLEDDLDTEPLPDGPLTPLLCYRIIERARSYSALTEDGRLKAVVDRDEVARRVASTNLKPLLER